MTACRKPHKGIINKRIAGIFFFFTLLLFISAAGRAQDTATNNAYFDLIKTWGVLKYYSPIVNKGKTDWDSVLISKFETITNDGPDSFYHNLESWVRHYSPGVKNRHIRDTIVSGFKNVDTLTEKYLLELTTLKVYKGYYFKGTKGCNYANLPCFVNEMNYSDKDLWRKEIRFLTLARFWNTIQYFYPYKDYLPEKWDSVLMRFIPAVINIKNPEVFQFLLLKLGVALHDTHMHINGGTLGYIWEKELPPVAVKWVEGQPVITAVYNDSIAKLVPLGTVILEIEGEPADSLVKSLSEYAGGDNEVQRANSILFDFILAGKEGSLLTLKVETPDSRVSTLYLERNMKLDDIQKAVQKQLPPSKLVNDSIGYINCANTSEKKWEHLMRVMRKTKGVVIDLREYPEWTEPALRNYLFKRKGKPTLSKAPDLHHPGKFITTKNGSGNGRERYKGKITALVSDATISRGEYFAMLLKQCGRDVTFVGTPTAGAVGTYTSAYLPGSIMISYTGTGEFYDDHTTAQIKGITPDEIVTPTLSGIQTGKDEAFNKAIEIITKYTKPEVKTPAKPATVRIHTNETQHPSPGTAK